MAEALEKSKRKRSTIRAMTTKLLQKIEKELATPKPGIQELEEAISQLTAKEIVLQELDRDIEHLTTNLEELDLDVQGAQDYQERIILWKGRAQRVIKKFSEDADNGSTSTQATGSERIIHTPPSAVKLPRLVLDKFYGDSSTWQSFWSQFEAAVHQNNALTKTDKFNYLKSYLGGTAANAVSGMSLTNDNYDSAVKILTDRFGRKDLVVNAHMNKLLSLTPVKKSTEVESLRKLYDICEVQVRSLEIQGVVSDTYGSLLCPILLKLVPDDIALEFTRRRDKDKEWSVKDLLSFLQVEIECRERSLLLNKLDSKGDLPTGGFKPDGNPKYREPLWREERKGGKPRIPSAAALNTTVMENRCIFCESNDHKSSECNKISVEIKRERLRKQGRCYMCLGAKHIAKYCRARIGPCTRCGRRHNKAVCDQNQKESQTELPPEPQKENNVATASVSQCSIDVNLKQSILLQTATVLIMGKNKGENARCLLDGGSQRTFIREDLSKALNLPVIGEETLHIHTFGSNEPTKKTLRKVKVQVRNVLRETESIEMIALEIPQVCGAIVQIPGEDIRKTLQRKGLQLADVAMETVGHETPLSLLIGGDYYWSVVTGRIERLEGSIVALETKFGWCVQGPTRVPTMTLECSVTAMKAICEEREVKFDQLKAFWELESLGITEDSPLHTELEKEAMNLFESQIKFKEGRYEVKLPWRSDQQDLPNNYRMAEKRLTSLTKRLKSDEALYKDYNRIIEEQIDEGIIEVVQDDGNDTKKGYYLPHHPVIREDKTTTKLRIVFDASSHENKCPSLNDCLLPGPNLNPNLLAVLLKFRRHKIAFTADIKGAFLQISLAEEDRDSVRLLWFEESTENKERPKLRTMRMTRVIFGVTSSPFLLAATIKHHLRKHRDVYHETSQLLDDDLYVDDLISGADDEDEAFKISMEAKIILADANMNLRKWRTNSKELQKRWDDWNLEDIMTKAEETPLKVLGLIWNTDLDELTFELQSLLKMLINRQNTKRYVLKTAARIFDPMGFLSPYVIRIKCLFQEIWERGLNWDEILPDELQERWNLWCLDLPKLQEIKIPRAYFSVATEHPSEYELHGFCDASEVAYGAVVYIRYATAEDFEVAFVISKTRVAPLKKLTLPRLELMGALIAARLINKVKGFLKIGDENIHLWCDSMITLHWICGSAGRWKPFVANRVTEIQSLTDPQMWSHCKGEHNPADLLTRGCSVGYLKDSELWWKGPPWLSMPESQWAPEYVQQPKELDENINQRLEVEISLQINCEEKCEQSSDLLILGNYSSVMKVYRITAWIKRFVANLKHTEKRRGSLTAEDIAEAEMYWVRVTQRKAFTIELEKLKVGELVPKESKIAELNPFLDENGLICVGGRLQKSKFSFKEKHPWIMPAKSKLCELQAQICHERVMHSGQMDTLIQLREKFWIIKGRQLVKSVIRKCLICRRFRAQPGTQVMAPLPEDRVSAAPPFEVTGVDFAGPLYVKGNPNDAKAYVALFTCAVTRAIHLELVSDLSTDKFMLALRRFISRRGVCKTIYSDNAKTFKRADKDLREIWKAIDNTKLQDFYGKHGISWKFIIERGAWWGGFWERMVRSVKTWLKKVLGKTSLTFEELETVLSEVEAVLNSRPLTFTYNEMQEPTPLTPAHFLTGERLTTLPHCDNKNLNISIDRGSLTKKFKYRQTLLENLWKRWQKEYLLELRSARFSMPQQGKGTFKVDDVVIVKEDKIPRHMWKLGRISEIFIGRDNKVRSCAVRLPNGIHIKRPIQLLYPLEL